MHEIEFGSTDPSLTPHLGGNFADFLESISAAHPGGPVTERLFEYVDAVSFVGKTESLAEDLCLALLKAGEDFNTKHANSHPLNSTGIGHIRESAQAPRALLEEVMRKDREFCQRFEYAGIPAAMVAERAPAVPGLSAIRFRKPEQLPTSLDRAEVPLKVFGTNHRSGDVFNTRLMWALETALAPIERRELKTAAQIHGGNGAVAHLVSSLGFERVDAIDVARSGPFDELNEQSQSRVNFIEAKVLGKHAAVYDVVVAHRAFALARSYELTIAALASLLKEGGLLVGVVPIIDLGGEMPISFPFKPLNSPVAPQCTILHNRTGLVEVLAGGGFEDVTFVDDFFFQPRQDAQGARFESICAQFGADSDFVMRNVTFIARLNRTKEIESGYSISDLEAGWWDGRPLWVDEPVDHKALDAARRANAKLKAEMKRTSNKVMELTGALADRQSDLRQERQELVRLRAHVVELHDRLTAIEQDLKDKVTSGG